MKNLAKVVCIGGGTGLSVLLRGLKNYPLDITALVTVADDGGSSGKIRSDMNIPSPGDLRNVIAALSDVEPELEKMFQYRFDSGEVSGHPVGNLMIAAMADIHGDFSTAIKYMSKILNVKGTVLPTTNDIATLNAVMKDGTVVSGESSITKYGGQVDRVYITPEDVKSTNYVFKAIEEADFIVMGPGSLYTSIIPNLVINGIGDKIVDSPVKKIYVANIMTQHGETDGYKVSDHIKAINKHLDFNIFDLVISSKKSVSEETLKKYRSKKQDTVELDVDTLDAMNVEIIAHDDVIIEKDNLIRHNTDKVAEIIYDYILDEKSSIIYKR